MGATAKTGTRRGATGTGRPGPPRVVVAATPANAASARLVAELRRRGIDAELVAPPAIGAVAREDDVVLGRLDVLPTLDGVEPGLLGLLLLERRGFPVLNPVSALLAAHDKLRTARALARASLPHPRTVWVGRDDPPPEVALPVVVKPRFGSWGADVFLCETSTELAGVLRHVRGRRWCRRHGALVQEFVPNAGRDVRVLVADGLAVGAVQRVAASGEWRTNVSLGGTRVPCDPAPEVSMLAVAAAAAIGGDLVGVDLLPCRGGWTVIELNGAVEFDAAYALQGRDVFDDVADALGLRA